jgi:hypothetical protein
MMAEAGITPGASGLPPELEAIAMQQAMADVAAAPPEASLAAGGGAPIRQ